MRKIDLDVEGRTNIADSQYKSTVKLIAIKSAQLIISPAYGFAVPQVASEAERALNMDSGGRSSASGLESSSFGRTHAAWWFWATEGGFAV